jgi:hypothetical protein
VRLVGAGADGLGEDVSVFREDDTALTFAELLAEIAGGYEPPPSA